VLVALSELAIAFPSIVSVDINPLVASSEGAVALDARIEIDPGKAVDASVNPGLLLRPYPSKEQTTAEIGDGRYLIRPIRPADAALYPDFLKCMDPEDMRRRFLVPTPVLSPSTLIRLTQLDYDREIAFVALDRSQGQLAGVVRYSADPDRAQAEFGVLVRSDLKGRGLGRVLMTQLIDYARREGVAELVGMVLADNSRMLSLCRALGFSVDERVSGENLIRTSLRLKPA
jgi:acetyltransferase